MMKNKLFILSASVFVGLCSSLYSISSEGLLPKTQQEGKIIVNNRILTKINGKPITTYDIAKKMDMGFYRYFPEYASSTTARYQYYQANWKYVLEELMTKELILADAQENKIEMSSGDVRQEMEFLFGPNMIENLDKAGMSFDEASKIVQGDLLLRRTLGARVNAKVVRLVTPAKVRKAYEEFIQDPNNARLTNWRYQVVTIRDRTPKKNEETANKVYNLLLEGVPLDKLIDTMKERNLLGRKAKINVSDEIQNNEKELSVSYKDVLANMEAGMYSQPAAQKSRVDHTTVYRLFYLKEKIPGGMPTFKEMENTLKEQLLRTTLDDETEAYLKKLKIHFHVRDNDIGNMVPANYQPFILK